MRQTLYRGPLLVTAFLATLMAGAPRAWLPSPAWSEGVAG